MNSSANTSFIVADIGGTHIRVAHASAQSSSLLDIKKYVCSEFENIDALLNDYLGNHSLTGLDLRACFAVAAPVSSTDPVDEIVMTNSNWRFSVAALIEKFGWQSLDIINDFEAVAQAVPGIGSEHLLQLGGSASDPDGNRAVLGPGTGLGVKHLVPIESGYKVLAGEGGHVDFAPVDDQDLLIWNHVRTKLGRASLEEVLSGRGLVHIYEALAGANADEANESDPAKIIEKGLSRECEACRNCLLQFCAILGSFSGNLALNLKTTGGVYLGGGVLSRISELIEESGFRQRFEAKGRFKAYVENIPAYLITEPEPGLLGALAFLNQRA